MGAAAAVAVSPLLNRVGTSTAFSPAGGGVDISWLPALEAAGGRYLDGHGKRIDPLILLRRAGITFVRIRLWVHPLDKHSGLGEVVTLAQRAKRAGLKVGLDLHYSDTWADPGHQTIPASWKGMDYLALRDQVYEYSRSVVHYLVSHGVVPAVVQPGNEISSGLLWPQGQLSGDDAGAWHHITGLLNSGIAGIRAATPPRSHINIVLHLATTGDDAATAWFLTRAYQYGLRPIDAVGLSYYPQWHGDLAQLFKSLSVAARVSKKPVLVAETAYPWTTHAFAGSQVIDPTKRLTRFAATPAGQAAYLRALWHIVKAVPGGRGMGIWWWEGLARDVSALGGGAWTGGMQNATLVDQNGKALPALSVLGAAH
jgi:arabinogalactan endo-1,4-beta-galactosidase